MKPYEIIFIILPMIIGYLCSFLCGIGKNAGKNVLIRPPSYVFMIVWPILYILLGFSWVMARQNKQILSDIFYSFITLILAIWIIVYGCGKNKKVGVYIIAITITLLFMGYTVGNDVSRLLLCPLIGWIFLAFLMNSFEVEKNNYRI